MWVSHKLLSYYERLAVVQLVVRCWRTMLCLGFVHLLLVERYVHADDNSNRSKNETHMKNYNIIIKQSLYLRVQLKRLRFTVINRYVHVHYLLHTVQYMMHMLHVIAAGNYRQWSDWEVQLKQTISVSSTSHTSK